jgi:hypothetical protein
MLVLRPKDRWPAARVYRYEGREFVVMILCVRAHRVPFPDGAAQRCSPDRYDIGALQSPVKVTSLRKKSVRLSCRELRLLSPGCPLHAA